MDSVWIKSALVQPPRILGVQLRPFSPWHALVLSAFDSPFVTGKGAPDIGDLVLALLVCADGYADKLQRLHAFQRNGIPKARQWMRWMFADWNRAGEEFELYLQAYTDAPVVFPDTPRPKYSRVLPPFKVVSTLMFNMGGITLAEAWDMPLCLANCFSASIAEDKGADLLGDDEAYKVEHAEEIFAAEAERIANGNN